MAREYTLASAGGSDFVRPMELLMQMVHERYNLCVHLDAWTLRNFDTFGIPRQSSYPGVQYTMFPGMEKGPAGGVPLPRCPNLWRSTMAGVPQPGSLRRYDQWEDWDAGYPFGVSHDLRLNYLSDMLDKISGRFVKDQDPVGLSGGLHSFNQVEQSASPKLSTTVSTTPPHVRAKFAWEYDQLVTVNHFATGTSTRVSISSDQHRLAMPIAGQGLLSAVWLDVTGTAEAYAGGPHTSPLQGSLTDYWRSLLPPNTLSPGWAASYNPSALNPGLLRVEKLRLRVCENDAGNPGVVIVSAPLLLTTPNISTMSPRFVLHQPIALDHTKIYWLVIDAPQQPGDRTYSLGLSDVPHADTDLQLKTWNGSAWVNHSQPSLKFSLHMPKFMWRSKQLWTRVSEFAQVVHHRSHLHSKRVITEEGGVTLVYAPDHPNLEDRNTAARSSPEAYMAFYNDHTTQNVWDVEPGQYASSRFPLWPNGYTSGYYSAVPSASEAHATGLLEARPYGPWHVGYYINYLASRNGSQVSLGERMPFAWRVKNFRCARFEFRTGVRVAVLDVPYFSVHTGVFTVNEVLTLQGGLAVEQAQLKVTAVDGAGLPTSLQVINPGRYVKLDTPQSGHMGWFRDGGRKLLLDLVMEVSEVVIVDPGEGYTSDSPVRLDFEPGLVWVATNDPEHVMSLRSFSSPSGASGRKYARVRAKHTSGRLTDIVIEDRGAGYLDGGIARAPETIEENSQDPALSSIWPGVCYHVNATRGETESTQVEPNVPESHAPNITGYEAVGDGNSNAARLNYNGRNYYPGETFFGVSGVSTFYSYFNYARVSPGIEFWCHYTFGCGHGARNTPWSDSGRLLARAKGDRLIPEFVPRITNTWQAVCEMPHNGSALNGPVLGMPSRFVLHGPEATQAMFDNQWPITFYDMGPPPPAEAMAHRVVSNSAELVGAVYFLKPTWDINLDHQDEGGGGSTRVPGLRVPEGLAVVIVEPDDLGTSKNGEGEAQVTVRVYGEASIQDNSYGEGEAELDVDAEGEADASEPAVAEIDVDAEGEGAAQVVQDAEGEAEIDADTEGEADASSPAIAEIEMDAEGEGAQLAAQEGEGEAEVDVDTEGEVDASTPEIAEIDVDAEGEGAAQVVQDGEGEAEIEPDAYGAGAGTVVTPVFDPADPDTLISQHQAITLATPTAGAVILWTRDGTDPTVTQDSEGVWTVTNGFTYAGALDPLFTWGSLGFTLKAIAVKDGWPAPSGIATESYTFVL